MDISTAQAKFNRGLSKIATKLGRSFTQYRAATSLDPISADNIYSTIQLYVSQSPNLSPVPKKYANPVCYGAYDGTAVKVGDYLVNDTATYFVAAQDDITVPVLVRCNGTLTVYRPTAGAAPEGRGFYGGNTAKASGATTAGVLIARNWPCNTLQGTKGEKSDLSLPLDTRLPWYQVKVPAIVGQIIKTGDQMEDANGVRYTISSVEPSELGYRLTIGYGEA